MPMEAEVEILEAACAKLSGSLRDEESQGSHEDISQESPNGSECLEQMYSTRKGSGEVPDSLADVDLSTCGPPLAHSEPSTNIQNHQEGANSEESGGVVNSNNPLAWMPGQPVPKGWKYANKLTRSRIIPKI